ncbi:MAG: 3-isopropylmalate dehydrogenase [Candidatus Gracilibacteria bacterium]|nr:3-isopropylmalate dehydrogenase [Candidatus Gracilibacteria bacterium]
MKTYNIAVLPGDGIGPEVCDEALKVLNAVGKKFDTDFKNTIGYIGGAGWDKYKSHFPDETKKLCDKSDAVLFGSVGGPVDEQFEEKWKNCERDSILAIRKYLGLTVNIRPAKVWPKLAHLSVLKAEKIPPTGIEIVTFRELSQGLYFGEHTTFEENGELKARDICDYSESTIKHIAKFCLESAKISNKKVALVDKANVLDTSRLWRKVVEEVKKDYPEVQVENWLVDNCAQQLVKNPGYFDYLLTENLFGDILSDLTSTFSGSLGLLASASFNKSGFGLYEPSGGSAPKYTGLNKINPIAQILCVAMMLKYSFGMEEASKAVENAVNETINAGFRTYDIFRELPGEILVGTREIGDEIMKRV